MRIRTLQLVAGPGGTWPAGTVVTVDEGFGLALIKGGAAAEAAPPPAKVAPAESAEAPPSEETAVDPGASPGPPGPAAAKRGRPKK